jgi:ABC-type polysaccharide transport system permease subunit
VVKKPLKSTTCRVPSERNNAEQAEQNTFVLTAVNLSFNISIIISLATIIKRLEQIRGKEKAHRSGLIRSVA